MNIVPRSVGGAGQYQLTEGPAATAELETAIAKADAELFNAVFIQCDADKVGVTPSRDAFLANLKKNCVQQAAGTNFRARRELVPGTLQVWPINNHGALETGVHRFYARLPGKADQLTQTGNFMILWKKVDGKWLMSETISYGHWLAH